MAEVTVSSEALEKLRKEVARRPNDRWANVALMISAVLLLIGNMIVLRCGPKTLYPLFLVVLVQWMFTMILIGVTDIRLKRSILALLDSSHRAA